MKWVTPRGILQSLYHMGLWYEEWENDQRAKALLRKGRLELHARWGPLLEQIVNDMYGDDVNYTFEFVPTKKGGKRSVAYGLDRDETPCLIHEARKGGDMFTIAGIARMFGQSKRLGIAEVDRRWFGKLTTWCKAHMGLSTHQVERDIRRHGRPSAQPPQMEVDTNSESETESM